MILLGALLAAVTVAALVGSTRRSSTVGRRLAILAPRASASRAWWHPVPDLDLRQSGLGLSAERIAAMKLACGSAAAALSAAGSLLLPVGPVPILGGAYLGYIAPSLLVARRAEAARRAADRATGVLVERIDALVSAGRPPETALALLMARPSGSMLLDAAMRRASDAYALGAPVFRTLAASARDDGLDACAAFADELDRARDLGRGSLAVIRERRNALRATQRARSLASASQVEGKLMLVLVLCYLPALVVLVVIPLFVGLLEGLFA